MQSRRLRGASAEASYEVGRDAALACVAMHHVPGRPPGSLPGTDRPQVEDPAVVVGESRGCRDGAPRGAGARVMSAKGPAFRAPFPERSPERPCEQSWGNAPCRRAIPLGFAGDANEGIRANPRARETTGGSAALAKSWSRRVGKGAVNMHKTQRGRRSAVPTRSTIDTRWRTASGYSAQ
jgi:hypothetical protein